MSSLNVLRPDSDDRLPPHNVLLEASVLSAILMDNEAMHEVAPILRPEDFFRDTHGLIYRVIRERYDAGQPTDFLMLSDDLERRGLFERIGGRHGLEEIADAAPHAANAPMHAAIVREHAAKRELIAVASEMLERAYRRSETSEAIQGAAEALIFGVRDRRHGSSATTALNVAALAAMDRLALAAEGRGIGLPTGIPRLDELTGGLFGGQVVVVGARPSQGKTSLLLQLALNFSAADRLPLFVSLEMSKEEIGERYLIARSGVDSSKCRRPETLTSRDMNSLGRAINESFNIPFEIDDGSARSVADIAAVARRMKARSGLGVVVVDYLQLVRPSGPDRESRQEKVSGICRDFKTLARELDVPVVLAAQLNREVENRENNRPRMSDIRESGAAEQDAHLILLLHRPDRYDPADRPGLAELIVSKNRNGATDDIRLRFDGPTMTFRPWDEPITGEAPY